MKLSVGVLTGRATPYLHWIIDDLANQAQPGDEIEIVVVDALEHMRSPDHPIVGDAELEALSSAPMIDLRIVPVRPNIWQGRHRVTAHDFWATAASRNTFLCVASHDYIAFLDDCCHLGPRWMESVRLSEGARSCVLAGSFDKLEPVEGDPGSRAISTRVYDHRRQLFPDGKINCGGAWLWGCTFCLPLEWALGVNGFEEGCDGSAGEDYTFGCMLENAGHRIDFVPQMLVTQERPVGNESCVGAFRKIPGNERSHAAVERFCKRDRTEFTPDLRALREVFYRCFPIPDPDGDHRDWFDGLPIAGRT